MEHAPIKRDSFVFLAKFLKEQSGYNLTDDKEYLLQSKLNKVVHKHRLESIEALAEHLRHYPDSELVDDIQQAMTINESYFFRDSKAFDFIIDKLEEQYRKDNAHCFTIWSAACSTGQEPYSLAMQIESCRMRFPDLKYKILATDINHHVLERAKKGIYVQMEVERGLTESQQRRFFTKEHNYWQIHEDLQQHIRFEHINLTTGPFPYRNHFDIALIRNVLIYFDDTLKKQVLDNVISTLSTDGHLLLGGAEIMPHNIDHLQQSKNVSFAYQKT